MGLLNIIADVSPWRLVKAAGQVLDGEFLEAGKTLATGAAIERGKKEIFGDKDSEDCDNVD